MCVPGTSEKGWLTLVPSHLGTNTQFLDTQALASTGASLANNTHTFTRAVSEDGLVVAPVAHRARVWREAAASMLATWSLESKPEVCGGGHRTRGEASCLCANCPGAPANNTRASVPWKTPPPRAWRKYSYGLLTISMMKAVFSEILVLCWKSVKWPLRIKLLARNVNRKSDQSVYSNGEKVVLKKVKLDVTIFISVDSKAWAGLLLKGEKWELTPIIETIPAERQISISLDDPSQGSYIPPWSVNFSSWEVTIAHKSHYHAPTNDVVLEKQQDVRMNSVSAQKD